MIPGERVRSRLGCWVGTVLGPYPHLHNHWRVRIDSKGLDVGKVTAVVACLSANLDSITERAWLAGVIASAK